MKSVGEAMAIGRTFKEALQKALRSLEIGSYGFEERVQSPASGVRRQEVLETMRKRLETPNAERLWYVADALRLGMSVEELYQITKIDPWFLENIAQIVEFERQVQLHVSRLTSHVSSSQTADAGLRTPDLLRAAKQMGFSDVRFATLLQR